MGYTIKIVRELNIPVIIQYQSHTPDAKKKYLPSLCPKCEVAASSSTQCENAEPNDIITADHTCSVGIALASPSLVASKRCSR